MKVIFKRESLLSSINIVLKAVSSKTTMPILECILIEASAEGVCLTANDTELGIETRIPTDKCTVTESGKIAVEAKLFSEIIRKIGIDNDSDILIKSNGNTIEISCDSSLFRIQEKDPDQFPALPRIDEDKYITISQFALKEAIKYTIFSISPNDSNKMMTGELFEVNNNMLKVASLDGHRISIRNTILNTDYPSVRVIIPGKTLIEITKILPGDADKNVDIFFSKNYAVFKFDDTVMVTRLIDGDYFRIESMLSSDYETKITLNKKDFLDNIERSTILIRENDKKPLVLNIVDSKIELKMNSIMGSMNSELMVNKQGKNLMIAFNPKFLMDALRAIDDEEIVLYMTNPKAPCFIKDDEEKYIYLILPINFNPAAY